MIANIIGLFLFFFISFVLLYKKYSTLYIEETSEIYKTVTQPYLNKMYIQNTKWISDMIAHKGNQIVYYRNSNFVICKDIKWKTNSLRDFYILAIPIEKIMTIRDLRKRHIELLESMKLELIRTAEAFKINTNDLVFFFHYMPSIFQLHLHCCLKTNYYATNISKGIYYYDIVLDKIRWDTYYWNKAILTYSISVHHSMCIDLYLK